MKQSEDSNIWQRVEPTTTHKVGWRTVVTKTFIMTDGNQQTFDTFGPEGEQHVCIIGLTAAKEVVIARQFRVGPEQIMSEIPGGSMNNGEDPQTSAEREFLEETGYKAGEVTYLGAYHKDAYMNATWHVYFATGCELVAKQQLEAEEHIEIRLISIDELIDNAKHDHMSDAVAVLMAYDQLQDLKKS